MANSKSSCQKRTYRRYRKGPSFSFQRVGAGLVCPSKGCVAVFNGNLWHSAGARTIPDADDRSPDSHGLRDSGIARDARG
jgi:hypothetical protein